MKKYEIVNAHLYRRCHPETCVCSTDYLVIENRKNEIGHFYSKIVQPVFSIKYGEKKINQLKEADILRGTSEIIDEGLEKRLLLKRGIIK